MMSWVRRNTDLVELLACRTCRTLLYGDSRDPRIHRAVQEDDEEMVKELIHRGDNLNKANRRGYTPLGLALTLGQPRGTAIAKILVQSGASPYKKTTLSIFQTTSYTPLHIACFKGNLEFVEFLVEKDIYMTCRSGRKISHTRPRLRLKHLLNQRAEDGSTPLFMAAWNGDLQVVDYLLRGGADPHFVCLAGNFLHAALKRKSLDVIKKGLDMGCDVNQCNSDGETPLHVASRINLPEACELLILGGADLNARDKFGATPLEKSVKVNLERNVRVLIQHGADINAVSKSKLYWRFKYSTSMIQFLLAGARLTSRMLRAQHYKVLLTSATPSLSSWIRQHSSNPQSLQALSCLVIRNQLINVSNGKSILRRIEALPLPDLLKDLLFLKDGIEIM